MGQFKLGQATAYEAMDRCIELADRYGIGQVSVDHVSLFMGRRLCDGCRKERIYRVYKLYCIYHGGGSFHGMRTYPWNQSSFLGFPTMDAVGFPVVIDWATSVIAMGRVQQLKREGKSLPPGAAVDQDGKET